MRHLHLLRHAKSAWDDAALADEARPLAPRGRRATRLLGRHLAGLAPAPDLVLCSTATRARQTWEGCAAAGGLDWPVEYRGEIYMAPPSRLFAVLRSAPAGAHAILLIGHNPGLEQFAAALAGEGSDADAAERLTAKYPTGGLASFEVPAGSWRALQAGRARLVAFETPARLEAR